MHLKTLSVQAKLAWGFGLLASIVGIVSALAMRALANGHEDFSGYVNEDSVRVTLANDILDAANARAIGARNLVLVSNAADKEAEKSAVGKAHDKMLASVASLKAALKKAHDITEHEHKLFAELERTEARYGPVALDIVKLALDDKRDEAVSKMNAECRPLLAALINAANAFIEHAVTQANAGVKTAESTYERSRNLLLAGSALAVMLAAALAVAITRSITRALGAEPMELSAAAGRVAAGNLSPLAGAQHAPAGSVLASLGDMQTSLSRVVGQVRAASDSIATGSAQIATGNADLSQRTEEQASNLQQTAASMEQMNSTVKNNAETARQATLLAATASAVASKGGHAVNQVVATMEDITASSRKIADIISVIDGIAFQTNILALNAAVEAARAGEQGRGFAVVASEVRNLAQRSAEAAREIKSLINASVEKVEVGSTLVSDAGATMSEIVAQVKRVADLIGDIGHATSEQTQGIGQVSDAVNQLDQVTQQNAALVEESAAAADSLKQQAFKLTELVSVFTLDQGQTSRLT